MNLWSARPVSVLVSFAGKPRVHLYFTHCLLCWSHLELFIPISSIMADTTLRSFFKTLWEFPKLIKVYSIQLNQTCLHQPSPQSIVLFHVFKVLLRYPISFHIRDIPRLQRQMYIHEIVNSKMQMHEKKKKKKPRNMRVRLLINSLSLAFYPSQSSILISEAGTYLSS